MYPKSLLYFHTIFLNPNCFQKDIGVNFYCRAPFQLDDYLSDECGAKRAVDYDVPHASSISDDQVYLCCGLLELEKMECPSSQLCGCHMALQTTATQV